MRKIVVVITARPSYSRVRSALQALRDSADTKLEIVVHASALVGKFGAVVKNMQQDGFEPSARLHTLVEGETSIAMVKTTAMGMLELGSTFERLKPDLVVSIADRYETIGTAIAASYMNIPVAHIQGGEVTGNIDDRVRNAVTQLSDLHLVSTPEAARRVIKMGADPQRTHVTGCPSLDVAETVLKNPGLDFDPVEKYGGVGRRIDYRRGYAVMIQHPVTDEPDQARRQITEVLEAMCAVNLPTFCFWPNPDAGSDGTSEGIRAFRELANPANMHFFLNMKPEDFLKLLFNSRVLVGNSSVGIRECSFLGVPVVNIGSRQSGREQGGNVLDVPCERGAVERAMQKQIAHGRFPSSRLYGDGHAGERVARILATAPL